MKIPFLTLTTLVCLAVAARAAGPGQQNDFGGKRVLIIGIDGCRRDVIEQAIKDGSAPHFAKLAAGAQAYWNMEAGGEPASERQQPTISGPGWSTLFTGVFANKHGVMGNADKFLAGDFKDYPHYFRYLRQAKPNAWLGSVVADTWPEINKIMLRASGENLANDYTSVPADDVMEGEVKRRLTDGNVTKEGVRCLREENPDVLFLYFVDVDHAGHQFGFSPAVPQYADTFKKLDASVGTVLEALEKRPQFKQESWLIAVVTDHGGIKKGHGGQSPDERQIFAFFNGPGFHPKEVREGKVFQSLVAPTVLNYLGVPIDPAWGFESAPVKLEQFK